MLQTLFNTLLNIELILAVVIFVLLSFITAPYGRFIRKGWGPVIPSRTAWIIMESPSFLLPLVFLFIFPFSIVSPVFLLIWMSHYFHRTLIYPFRISDPKKPFSLLIMSWGFLFNLINSFVNFYYLFYLRPFDNLLWLTSWQFICGFIIFISGFIINKNSDAILRKLRIENKKAYSIPRGGMFRWISAPNYLGEIVEWAGWALLTWSLGGLAFFLFTVANLAPRAVKTHKWYKNNFEDYPVERKAILPYIC